MKKTCHAKHASMPCIISLFAESSADVYSQKIRTGIILLNGWVILSPRRRLLFQNRYKSILCQEDIYLLELVRYIHLNPLRAKIVKSPAEFDNYPYSGHSALMGKVPREFQDTDYVLGFFGEKVPAARKAYRAYVKKGIAQGRRPELVGGV